MSYATEAELTAYATERGITLTGDLSALLTKAHDYIESKDYKGYKSVSTQETKFPRTGIYVDGVLIDSATIPNDIKKAEMRTAIEIDQGNDPLATYDRETKREKLGEMEVEYMDRASRGATFPAVDALLKPYLSYGSSGALFDVVKA